MLSRCAVLHLSLIALAFAGECPWSTTIASSFDDFPSSVTLDSEKNRFISGSIGTTNGKDGFLASFSSDGTQLWNRTFGAGNVSVLGGLDIDAQTNDVAFGGSFYNEFLWGTDLLSTFGSHTDGFVGRMNREGTVLWARRFGTPDYDDATTDVAMDSNHNLIYVGVFAGIVNFGGVPLESKDWSYDLFIAKYDVHGSFVWSQNFGGNDTDEATAVSVDLSNNDIVVTATFRSADFDLFNLHGGTDVLVLKLNSSGDVLWSRSFGGGGDDAFLGIAVDSAHSIYVTGFVSSGIDFGTGPLDCAGKDAAIVKLNSEGIVVWTRTFPGSGDEEGRSLDVGTWLFITGIFSSPIDFGQGTVTPQGKAFFVLKLNLDGEVIQIRTYQNSATAIAYDSIHDDFAVIGSFSTTFNYGSGTVASIGGTDIFLLNDGFDLPACSPSSSPSPSASPSPLPSQSATPTPSNEPTPSGSATPSSEVSPTTSISPSHSSSVVPSPLPSIEPILKSPSASPAGISHSSDSNEGGNANKKNQTIMIVLLVVGLSVLLLVSAGAVFLLIKKNILKRPSFLNP